MNQEMQNVASAIMYTAMMHDKKQEEIEAKAKKYDKLKEAIGKIKNDLEDLDIYEYTAGHGDNYREYDFVKYHEVLGIINIRTEGLI